MKPLGGILLVIGTAIGGGMLALPMATSLGGFWVSVPLFIFMWAWTTLGALYILEMNLTLDDGSHLVSMARVTLGIGGQAVVWVCYLLLLFCAIAAYISSGADLLGYVLAVIHIKLPMAIDGLLFTILLAWVIYAGIKQLDWANRLFMLLKLLTFMALLYFVLPHVHTSLWQHGYISQSLTSIPVVAAAFTFGIIVPSLRHYFANKIRVLHWVIVIGSLVPLIAYLLWDAAVQGVVPTLGEHGLFVLTHSTHAVSGMATQLGRNLGNQHIVDGAQLFSSVCVFTSFLGVGLSLVSFLADGLNLPLEGAANKRRMLFALTFVPPWLLTVFIPQAFVFGLRAAGVCAVLLMMVLPGLMVYRSRYHLKHKRKYIVFGGKRLLLVHISVACVVAAYVFYHLYGQLF